MCYKTILKNSAMLFVALTLTLTACKRNKTDNTTSTTPALTNSDDNGGYATDAAKLEESSNDALSIADAAAATGGANLRTSSGYPVVTNDTSVSPRQLTIDFGPTNHLCLDGKNRRGKILVSYTGKYKDAGSIHTITFSNYYVNDIQRTGSKTVENKGMNTSGQYYYTVTVNDSLILATDSVISWTGNRTRTWLAGYSTSTRSDDEYQIDGTTTVKRANGRTFTMTITTPLHVAVTCPYIESGVMTISSSSFSGGSRTLDYGTGGCDNSATLTVGTHTYTITLR